MKFPQPTKDDVQTAYREQTDKPLPGTLNPLAGKDGGPGADHDGLARMESCAILQYLAGRQETSRPFLSGRGR